MADAVEAADQHVLRFLGNLERPELLTILREHEPFIRALRRLESQWDHRGLGGLHTQSGEPLKLRECGRSGPCEKTPCQLGESLLGGELESDERTLLPEHIAIALLIEAAIGRNPADLPCSLEPSKSDRQRSRKSLLLACIAEIPYRAAASIAQLLGLHRPAGQCIKDCRTELVAFRIRHPELAGRFPFV